MSSTNTTSLFQTLTPQNGLQLNNQPTHNASSEERQKKSIPKVNVLHTAPIFFVNSQKEEKKRPLEPELQRSGSISLNYGDRRLSNILSDTKQDQNGSIASKKKVLIEPANPSRGLFGDGNVYKRMRVEEKKKKEKTQEEPILSSTSIRVYGFPTHLTEDLRRYYEKYGSVIECRRSLSDWITVTFDSHASALQALKNNNTEIYGHSVRIIPSPEPPASVRQGVITLEESKNLFKQSVKPAELGQGKEGITAFDGQVNEEGVTRPVDNGLFSKLKETFFGW